MITDVHHVGIAVRDLAAALSLFHEALGLPVAKQGEAAARGARVALLEVGGRYLELVQPTTEDSPFAKHISERGEGLHHLGLWTEAVEDDVAALRDAAVPLEDHEPRAGFTGSLAYLAPEAFDGAIVELVQPEVSPPATGEGDGHSITRIDHVVLRVPNPKSVCSRFEEWFELPAKRTFERGPMTFAFLRPGDVIIEIIGPTAGDGDPGSARIAGLAFEVTGIDQLTASLKAKRYPIGEPHPALQGGRIVSVHHSGACGVPLAFIDFS